MGPNKTPANFKRELLPVPQTDFYHLLPVRCGRSGEKAQSCAAGAEDGSEQSRHRESRHRRDGQGFTVKADPAVGRLPGVSAVHIDARRTALPPGRVCEGGAASGFYCF